MIPHVPENTKPYDKIWAILARDKDGKEGIVAVNTFIGPQAAITGEERVLQIYIEAVSTPQAKAEAREAGRTILIGEFTRTNTRNLK